MKGKKGLVFGIANKMSISWAIAKTLSDNGAILGFNYLNENNQKKVTKLGETINVDFFEKCDVTEEEDIKRIFEKFYSMYGSIDFIVHSIAFGEMDGKGLVATEKSNFSKTLEISVYSLITMCNHAKQFFSKDASVVTLTYLGSSRVCVGYNVMGVAKAALNSSCRYLAEDLGKEGVRVNAISAGPLRTSAAMGIPFFKEMLEKTAVMSPLKRNVTFDDVAKSALFLLSDMSSGITGEVINVDCGYNIMGTWSSDYIKVQTKGADN